jgi:hypothetical protein
MSRASISYEYGVGYPQEIKNLNDAVIQDEGYGGEPLLNHSTSSGSVSCYFKNLAPHLISKIKKYDCVVGCVAWLTEPSVLDALAETKGCSIVVQKEDFLRPDSNNLTSKALHELYSRLKVGGLSRYYMPSLMSLSYCSNWELEAVRCVGVANIAKQAASPRMHHKFVVFGNLNPEGWCFEPKAVWTGSFNFTHNGRNSLENAVFIEDEKIANAYFQEYSQVYALSEPLDWKSVWVAPEYRIGS